VTTCDVPADTLDVKLLSPAYEALRVFVPATITVTVHDPAETLAVHELPDPSLIVTLPVGPPLPGAAAVTVNPTETGCPATDELGVCDVIVVAVFALFTVSLIGREALAANVEIPAYDAVSE
jgi:hypothetical protein